MQMYGDFAEKFLFSAFFLHKKKPWLKQHKSTSEYTLGPKGAVDLWVWQGMRMDLVWPNI